MSRILLRAIYQGDLLDLQQENTITDFNQVKSEVIVHGLKALYRQEFHIEILNTEKKPCWWIWM